MGESRNTANTTTYNRDFPAPHSRKVTLLATRSVHPHSWSQPTKTPTFPHQKAKKSPFQQHVVSYNPSLPGPSTWRAPQEAHPPRTQNPRKQHRQRRSPGIPRESRGRERRRRDLNPRGAMHPYLLSREAHSTGLCDVSSADYFRTFLLRTRTAPAAHTRKRIGMAEGEGFEPPVPLLTQRFSRPSLSATQTALQTCPILQEQTHTREADDTGTGTAHPAAEGEVGAGAHHI